jgi:rubrerythrin
MVAWVDEREGAAKQLVAGAEARGEYRCTGCGYGVTVYRQLPRCPMCGAEEAWEQLDWVPPFDEPLRPF